MYLICTIKASMLYWPNNEEEAPPSFAIASSRLQKAYKCALDGHSIGSDRVPEQRG